MPSMVGNPFLSHSTCGISILTTYIYVFALHPVCDMYEENINAIFDRSSSIHLTIGMIILLEVY